MLNEHEVELAADTRSGTVAACRIFPLEQLFRCSRGLHDKQKSEVESLPAQPCYNDVVKLSELENILKNHRAELDTFGVRQLYVVGSVARGEARPGSDVDFVVELERYTLRDFVGLKLALEDWLGMAVDLATLRSLKPRLRKELEGDMKRVA